MLTLPTRFVLSAATSLVALTLIVAPALAAAPGSNAELDQVMAMMTQRLTLSPQQAEAIRPRVKAHLDAMRELFASYRYTGAGSLPALYQEFDTLRDHFRADLDVYLNDKQMEGLAELRDEVDASIRDTVVDYRVGNLRDELGLSAEQVDAIRPIIADNFDARARLISFHTDEAGGQARLQRNLGPEIEQTDQQMEKRLEGVLTKQQMDSYHQYLAKVRQHLRDKEAVSQ